MFPRLAALVLLLLGLPFAARADVIIPFTAAGSPISWLLLLPVIALEAAVLKPVLKISWGRAMGASARANGITMGVGYFLLLLLLVSLFAIGRLPAGGISNAIAWNVWYWHLLPWGYLLSYLIEKHIVQNYLEGQVVQLWTVSGVGSAALPVEAQVRKACAWANLTSYAFIAIVGAGLNTTLAAR